MKRGLLLALVLVAAVPASAARAPLTASRDWWPVFSPDDRQIAFTRINGTGRVMSLEVLSLTTHRVVTLGSGAGQLDPTWSPDGTQIAYASGGVVYVVGADGSGKHRYLAPSRAFAPSWRPGTTELAYLTTHGATNTDLWVANRLWARDVIGRPTWVPGGDALAFTRDDGVYLASASGAEQRLATTANPEYPTPSPDGTFVAYVANGYVWVVRADGTGGGPLRLAGPYRDIGPPSWSRESDSLAYTVPGTVEITYLDTGRTVPLVAGAGVGTSFAHHGDLVAFSGLHPGCTGHTTIRVYEDSTSVPAYTGGCAIAGTPAGDVIYGTSSAGDVILGRAGDDRIHAVDGHRDRVDCGSGRDVVWADRVDYLVHCEVVHR